MHIVAKMDPGCMPMVSHTRQMDGQMGIPKNDFFTTFRYQCSHREMVQHITTLRSGFTSLS